MSGKAVSSANDAGDAPAGWSSAGRSLQRTFLLNDFAAGWAFLTEVAMHAQRLDHHPDWSQSWNRVTISLTSHDVGRVTGRDYELAEVINAIADRIVDHVQPL